MQISFSMPSSGANHVYPIVATIGKPHQADFARSKMCFSAKGYSIWDESSQRYVNYTDSQLQQKLNDAQLLGQLGRITTYRGDRPLELVTKLNQEFHRPDHAFLFAQASLDVSRQDKHGTGRPLIDLLPALLFHYPFGIASGLVSSVEVAMDNAEKLRHYHANEAELLALLNHPQNQQLIGNDVEVMTLGITSIDRWKDYEDVNVTPKTVHNWRRIGLLTHGFQFWRYDAERAGSKKCLLEEFGFDPVLNRQTDKPFPVALSQDLLGNRNVLRAILHFFKPKRVSSDNVQHPGYGNGVVLTGKPENYRRMLPNRQFKLIAFDRRCFVEFRRAYLLISHPNHGTLIIRNSSPEFGRDSMAHPAYWSPKGLGKGFTQKDLLGIRPEFLNAEFTPILHIPINHHYVGLDDHADFLLNHLIGVKEAYRAWKFDTNYYTAWHRMPKKSVELKGGYLSSGFKHLADSLETRLKWPQYVMPELAFVNPFQPPWEALARCTVTRECVQVLKALANGTATEEQLIRTGLRSFLQKGFEKQGELVLRSPLEYLK